MEIEEAVLLRIFVGEDKRHENRPLYEAIALKAREMHLLGATVLHGRLGYGRSTRLHTTRALMSEDLPLVIEIVDKAERIEAFMPVLAAMHGIALITRERVEMVREMPAP
jgi:PII-like signaling protein